MQKSWNDLEPVSKIGVSRQEFLGIKAKLELILIVDHALVSICNAIEDAVLTSDSRNNKLLKQIYDAYKFRNRTDIAEAKERID